MDVIHLCTFEIVEPNMHFSSLMDDYHPFRQNMDEDWCVVGSSPSYSSRSKFRRFFLILGLEFWTHHSRDQIFSIGENQVSLTCGGLT